MTDKKYRLRYTWCPEAKEGCYLPSDIENENLGEYLNLRKNFLNKRKKMTETTEIKELIEIYKRLSGTMINNNKGLLEMNLIMRDLNREVGGMKDRQIQALTYLLGFSQRLIEDILEENEITLNKNMVNSIDWVCRSSEDLIFRNEMPKPFNERDDN